MSEENLFNKIRTKLNNSEFLAQTTSKGENGFSIVFHPPDLMDVRGGYLNLPPGMFLRLAKKSVKYHFDPKIFDSSLEYSSDLRDEFGGEIKEINTALKLDLDNEWQILRLFDPRFLLLSDNFNIQQIKESKNLLEIKTEYYLTNFLHKYFPKIKLSLHEIQKKNSDQRIAKIYLDDDNNLKKIVQEDLFSKDQITTHYYTDPHQLKERILSII